MTDTAGVPFDRLLTAGDLGRELGLTRAKINGALRRHAAFLPPHARLGIFRVYPDSVVEILRKRLAEEAWALNFNRKRDERLAGDLRVQRQYGKRTMHTQEGL